MDSVEAKVRQDRRPPLTRSVEGKIDGRGRVAISADNVRALGSSFVLSRNFTGAVAAYPEEEFYRLIDEIDALPTSLAKEEYCRLIFEDTEWNIKVDEQNRFVMPEHFRKLAKLDLNDKIWIVGCGKYLEFWSESQLESFKESPKHYCGARRDHIERLRTTLGLVI